MSKAGVVLSADKKKASEAPKTKVKESKKNLSQTPQPLRVSPAAQKTLPESLQNGTILRSVLGSPLPGSVVSLLGAETNIRQIPPRR